MSTDRKTVTSFLTGAYYHPDGRRMTDEEAAHYREADGADLDRAMVQIYDVDTRALELAKRFYDIVIREEPHRHSQTIARLQIEITALLKR